MVIAMHIHDSGVKNENQDLDKLQARMAVMLTIIKNIEDNVELINKGNTSKFYLQVHSEMRISDMMRSKDQIFINYFLQDSSITKK